MKQTQRTPHGLFVTGNHATTLTSSDPPCSTHAATATAVVPPPTMYSTTTAVDWKGARHPSADDWQAVKHLIHQMYVVQKLPLREVRTVLLGEHGIKASDRMIKSRLKDWGFVKNAKKDDWGLLAVLHERRKIAGKHSTVFNVHGHRKTLKDLHRFIRNQNQSAEQFLAEYQDLDEVPDYIRAWTPDPEEDIRADSPPPTTDLPPPPPPLPHHPPPNVWSPSPTNPTSPPSHTLSHVLTTDSTVNATPQLPGAQPLPLGARAYLYSHQPAYRSNAPDSDDSGIPSAPDTVHISPRPVDQQLHLTSQPPSHLPFQIPTPPLSETCQQMDAELEACGTQLLKPQRLVSKIGMNDMQFWSWLFYPQQESNDAEMDVIQICSRCKQPSQRHFRSLDNFEPVRESPNRNLLNDCHNQTWHLPVSTRDEGAWLWVSRCFLACMCFTRDDEKMGLHALSDAVAHFEKLLERGDRLILTAAVLMTAILHMHDQSEIAFRILESAKEAADRHFDDVSHPLRITMRYFMHSANNSFEGSGIDSTQMEAAYLRLQASYRYDHPYVIAARHNYSWMLKWEGKVDAAEIHLKGVYETSCQVFGEDHMQSILALSLIAGCLSPQEDRLETCIAYYRDVIHRTEDILGVNHPYRLEAKRRLAAQLIVVEGNDAEVLQLLKEVLWGRAKMLGRAHSYTQGARTAYEHQLNKSGRWLDAQTGEPSGERVEVDELFNRDFQDVWVDVTTEPAYSGRTVPVDAEYDEGRDGLQHSASRTPSPTKSDDYAAY